MKRACGRRRTGPVGLCVVLVGALLALPGVASATVRADFNGDGRADLAVGAPFEEDAGSPYYEDTGAVNVLYGTASGLSASGNQLWHQDSAGILDVAELGDDFGSALAAGDFNGDGRADLAVGVHAEDVGGVAVAGAVNVLYGTASGLSASGNQLWHQNSPGVEEDDRFGRALG